MAKTTQKARQAGSKLKRELESSLEDRIAQARAAATAAAVRLDAASDEEKPAAQAELNAATAELGDLEKAAARLADVGSVADLLGQDAPTGGRVVITVIGPAKGRRRAGHQFDATPRTIAVTPDELKLIEGDAELAVTPGELPEGTAGGYPAGPLPLQAFLGEDGNVRPVKVLGPAKGRRRAGHQFGPQAVTIEPTRAELELILGDTELSVTPA